MADVLPRKSYVCVPLGVGGVYNLVSLIAVTWMVSIIASKKLLWLDKSFTAGLRPLVS